MFDNQDNFITNFTSLFPPSPPPSSNQSEVNMKVLVDDDEEKQVVEIVDYTLGPSTLSSYSYTFDEQEEEQEQDGGAFMETSISNEDVLKDLSDFISQSRASPRTPPVTPRMMFFLGDDDGRHPYQQMQQHQPQPIMDFDLYDLIDSSPYSSDYQMFPTLPSNNSS